MEKWDREFALTQVGAGWATLVNALYGLIEGEQLPVTVVQVKEKFGGLRFYYDWDSEAQSLEGHEKFEFFDDAVRWAENLSLKTCEECGGPGVQRRSSWVRTLCDEHARGVPQVP